MAERATPEEWAVATIEDVDANPSKYGAPTYQEYLRDPEKFRKAFSEQGKLETLDRGSKILERVIQKQVFIVNGIMCSSPEKAERVAKDENIDLRFYRPELIEIGGGKADLHLIFEKKKEPSANIVFPDKG